MTEPITGMYALRTANHLYRKLATQGVSEEDLERLAELRDWIRGMVALDAMTAAAAASLP